MFPFLNKRTKTMYLNASFTGGIFMKEAIKEKTH